MINEIKVIEIGHCLGIGTHNQIFMYFTEMIDEHYKQSSSF